MTDKCGAILRSDLYLFVLGFFEFLGSIHNGGNRFREITGGHEA